MEYFVVILNYNSSDDTIKTVEKLRALGVSNILIVDNCSSDNSYEIIRNKFNNINGIIVLKNIENSGYARGNNFAIKYIEERHKDIKYIVIMNPDVTILDIKIIDDLIKILEANQDIAIISGLQIYNGKLNLKKSAWRQKKFPHILLQYLLMKNLDLNGYRELDIDLNNKIAYVDTVPGCFFIVKKDIFKDIGLFDENTFLYYEEDIMCCKIRKKGYKVALSIDNFYVHSHLRKNRISLRDKYKHYLYGLSSAGYYLSYCCKINYIEKIILYLIALIMLPIKLMIYLVFKFFNK